MCVAGGVQVNGNFHSNLFLNGTSWNMYPILCNNITFSQTMVLPQTGIMNSHVVNRQGVSLSLTVKDVPVAKGI